MLLETIEGNRITTTEYYGLKDFGLFYIFIAWAISIIYYPIVGAPITVILHFLKTKLPLSMAISGFLGMVGGVYAFNKLFNSQYDGYFVQQYDLQMSTAIIIFIVAGCAYAAADHAVRKLMEYRANRVS